MEKMIEQFGYLIVVFYKKSVLINSLTHFDSEDEKNNIYTNLTSHKEKLYKYSLEYASSFIGETHRNITSIFPLTIKGNNPRLIAQNGSFLFPTNLKKSFEENLCNTLEMTTTEFSTASKKNKDKISKM